MLAPCSLVAAVKSWRKYNYIDIEHAFRSSRGNVLGICTLVVEDEVLIITLMHCKNENEETKYGFPNSTRNIPI